MPELTRFADRLEIVELPASQRANFGEDVRRGLTAEHKVLSSKYFYDEIGSVLFDAITLLPEYYLTRAEAEILHEWGWEIVRSLDEPIEFLELGSGSAVKTRVLIDEALRAQGTLRYSPIDISPDALRHSAIALVEAYPALRVRAYAADYFDVLDAAQLSFERRVLAMFMGSNIGNYAPAVAGELLTRIAGRLRPGDGLLLGADKRNDPAVVRAAYDDPAGVTAAFNRNVLARINRELGGTFDPRAFEHVVRYDEDGGCVRSYLEARDAQRVRVEALDLDVAFARGERIHTESSYKFTTQQIAELAREAGFGLASSWSDRAQRFGVYLLVRA